MSDEKDKNQDSDLDLNPEAPVDESTLLSDVDKILSEEDPDFFKQIENIKIDAGGVDLSIMEQALAMSSETESNLLATLRKPFDFRTNRKAALIFWGFIFFGSVALVMIWRINFGLLNQRLFITSLGQLGDEVVSYNPISEVEEFYDNPRFAKNIMTISPLVVNLRPSESSGDNPILAIQVSIEGVSSDATIEIKDREAEFKDMMRRITEEKSYDELVVAEGKLQICEQYRDALNARLTTGQVRRVLLKSFVLKP